MLTRRVLARCRPASMSWYSRVRPFMVAQTHPCVRATYSDVITTTRADHVGAMIVDAYRSLSGSGRAAIRCMPRGTPRLNTAPLVLYEAGARGEIRFRWHHMPPALAQLDAAVCALSPLAPASEPWGRGFTPRLRIRFGFAHRDPVRPRWGAVAAWTAARAWLPLPGSSSVGRRAAC